MRSFLQRLVAIAATVVVLAACGDDAGSQSSTAAPDGAALYTQNCAVCHGADLEGTGSGPPLLSIVYEPSHHPDVAFRSAIRSGVRPHHWDFGPMPPIRGLDDEEIGAIIDFVRAEQERRGFIE